MDQDCEGAGVTTNSTNILLKKQGITACNAYLRDDGEWSATVQKHVPNVHTYFGMGRGKTHSSAVRVAVRHLRRVEKLMTKKEKRT